jgi:hypothetical protein
MLNKDNTNMCCVGCSRPFSPWGRARFVAWVAATFSKLNPNSCQGPKRIPHLSQGREKENKI